MSAPTVLDIAKAWGAKEVDGGINGGEFERLGLPMMGGCQVCGATIACYNSYPAKNGYLVGSCCEQEVDVYESVEAFEKDNPRFDPDPALHLQAVLDTEDQIYPPDYYEA